MGINPVSSCLWLEVMSQAELEENLQQGFAGSGSCLQDSGSSLEGFEGSGCSL